MSTRRTQASRRAETQAAVLRSATKLFGSKGYAGTSLDEIANDCGISIAPIYHYFGNKQKLFLAVNEAMEERIVVPVKAGDDGDKVLGSWQVFLKLCQEPEFRRIVLVDGPTVLGRERMSHSRVTEWTLDRFRQRFEGQGKSRYQAELIGRMMMGAMSEAGLFIGNADDPEQASKEAHELVQALVQNLSHL